MRAIKSPKLRAKLDEIEKKSEIERKTNQLLSEIDENTENWARRRNTINKVRLDLNEFEKLDPFFILRSEKAKRLNDLESKDGITEEESQEANNLKEELELLSTNETQFELSNNSLKKRRLTRELENLKQALKSKKVERALLQKKLSKNELKREAGELEKKLKKITNKNNKKILNSSIVVDLSYTKTILPQTRVLTCADLLQNLTVLDEVDEFIITVNYRLSSFTAGFGRLAAVITNPTKSLEILSRMFDNSQDECGIFGGGCLTPSDIARMFLLLNKYLIKRQFRATSQPAMSDEICQIHYVRDESLPLLDDTKTVKFLRTNVLSNNGTPTETPLIQVNNNGTPGNSVNSPRRLLTFPLGIKSKRTKKFKKR